MNFAQKAISKIYRKIHHAKNDIGNLWGGNERLFRDARGAWIVVYHCRCEEDPIRFNNSFLTRKTFYEWYENNYKFTLQCIAGVPLDTFKFTFADIDTF